MIINAIGGGDSLGLKLDVVASTTKPENPVDNTIWINTDQTLGKVYFQATAPTEVVTGDVWVNTGVRYNKADQSVMVDQFTVPIMTNPCLTICINTVMMYNESSWVRPDVEVFIGGEWRPKVLYLFDHGTYSSLGNFGYAIRNRGTVHYYLDGYKNDREHIAYNNSGYIYITTGSMSSDEYPALVSPKVSISEFNTLYIVAETNRAELWIVKAKSDMLEYYNDSDSYRWYHGNQTSTKLNMNLDISSYSGEVFIIFDTGYDPCGDFMTGSTSLYGVKLYYMALY